MQNRLGVMKTYETVLGWVYFPMFALGTQLIIGIVLAVMGYDLQSEDTLLKLNVWNSGINLAAIVAIFHRFLFDQLRRLKGNAGRLIGSVLLGYLIYWGGGVLANVLRAVLSGGLGTDYVNQNQDTVEQFIHSDVLGSAVMMMLCAPIVEECLLRGLIFRPLYPRSRVLAYALSMLLFAFLHVYSSLITGTTAMEVLINVVTYLPAGFALAWVYARTETIWASILLHLLANSLSIALLLLL